MSFVRSGTAIVWLCQACLWSRVLASRGVEGIGIAEPLRFVGLLNSNNTWWQEEESHNRPDDSLAEGEKKIASKITDDDNDDVQELFISQRLDHFAPSNGRVFNQRYFFSDRFVDPSRELQYALLCVGGEGPMMTKAVLVDSVHCSGDMLELASLLYSEKGASVSLFGLEHRYYGQSYPVFKDENGESLSPASNDNLVYLSSRQALADIAHFVTATTVATPGNGVRRREATSTGKSTTHYLGAEGTVPSRSKWVTFGGSYPGMLAGWARLKYPHLIHAAVSNSAPIQAKIDMASYNDWVAFDLQYEFVGGSEECLHIFQEGHAQLVDGLEKGDASLLNNIAEQFNLCDASDLKELGNAQEFLGDGVVELRIQSNDPSCQEEMCNIEQMCKVAKAGKSANATKASWEVLAEMARKQRNSDECMTLDWNGTLDYIADPQRGMRGGLRSWLWQTCTEFGFYQTCEMGSHCPYGQGYHTLEHDLQICSFAFGVSNDEVKANIQQTLEYYGDKELKGGSRILSVNGNVDPWSTLARTNYTAGTVRTDNSVNNEDALLPVYNVVGASHHFWTHPAKDTDSRNVLDARTFIHETVLGWLAVEGGGIVSNS